MRSYDRFRKTDQILPCGMEPSFFDASLCFGGPARAFTAHRREITCLVRDALNDHVGGLLNGILALVLRQLDGLEVAVGKKRPDVIQRIDVALLIAEQAASRAAAVRSWCIARRIHDQLRGLIDAGARPRWLYRFLAELEVLRDLPESGFRSRPGIALEQHFGTVLPHAGDEDWI